MLPSCCPDTMMSFARRTIGIPSSSRGRTLSNGEAMRMTYWRVRWPVDLDRALDNVSRMYWVIICTRETELSDS